MKYELILKVTETFYDIAKKDILIGYHFRVIEDFDTHIPKIADFWNLQLNGEIQNKEHLPFDLFNVHKALNINKGEIGRWVILFENNLKEYLETNEVSKEQFDKWMDKVHLFEERLTKMLFRP